MSMFGSPWIPCLAHWRPGAAEPFGCDCPERKTRPPMDTIVTYWKLEQFRPHCLRCGWWVDEWRDLDRSHLLARVYGGSNATHNFLPLCRDCNLGCPDDDWSYCLVWAFSGLGGVHRTRGMLAP